MRSPPCVPLDMALSDVACPLFDSSVDRRLHLFGFQSRSQSSEATANRSRPGVGSIIGDGEHSNIEDVVRETLHLTFFRPDFQAGQGSVEGPGR